MEISSDSCLLGYGNPSGYLVRNSFLWITAYLHQYYEVGVQQRRMSVFCTEYIIKMAASAAMLCFFVFLGFSRVYLGASTLNQVLFGFSLGVVLAFIGHFKVKPLFLGMPEFYYSSVNGSSYRVGCLSYPSLIIFSLLLPIGLAFGVFLMKNGEKEQSLHNSSFWRKNMLLSSCEPEDLSDFNSLQFYHFH